MTPDKIYLMIGQSLARGATNVPYTVVGGSVYKWNGVDDFVAGTDPFDPSGTGSIVPALGNELVSLFGGTVGFVQGATGGVGIANDGGNEEFSNYNSVAYQYASTNIGLVGASLFDGVIILAAEGDQVTWVSSANFATGWDNFIANLATDGLGSIPKFINLPFWTPTATLANRQNVKRGIIDKVRLDPLQFIVSSSEGVSVQGDGHPDQAGNTHLGERIANAIYNHSLI